MRHAITLASRYWESKINYLVTDGRVRKRIDVQRGVDQVQLFDPHASVLQSIIEQGSGELIREDNVSSFAYDKDYFPSAPSRASTVAITSSTENGLRRTAWAPNISAWGRKSEVPKRPPPEIAMIGNSG